MLGASISPFNWQSYFSPLENAMKEAILLSSFTNEQTGRERSNNLSMTTQLVGDTAVIQIMLATSKTCALEVLLVKILFLIIILSINSAN